MVCDIFKMFKLNRFQSPRRFVLSTWLGNVPTLVPFRLFQDLGAWCHRSCRRVAVAGRYVKWPDCCEAVNTCRGFFCMANVGRPMEHCERPHMLHLSWVAPSHQYTQEAKESNLGSSYRSLIVQEATALNHSRLILSLTFLK